MAGALDDVGVLDGFGSIARLACGIPAVLLLFGVSGLSQAELPAGLRLLGGASYSLYLFQFVFIGIAWQVLLRSRLADAFSPPAEFLLLVLAALLGGLLASRLVEKPLIALCRTRPAINPARQSV